jgi:hypothetical protein
MEGGAYDNSFLFPYSTKEAFKLSAEKSFCLSHWFGIYVMGLIDCDLKFIKFNYFL